MNTTLAPKGIPLPISDWILTFLFLCLYPIIIISGLTITGFFTNDLILIVIIVLITVFTSLLILYKQFLTHQELKYFAEKVRYVHFRPSMKDILLHLFTQIFSFGIQAALLFILIRSFLEIEIDLWGYLVLSGIFTIIIQLVYLVLTQLSKRSLFKTAQEPIPSTVSEQLKKNYPISHKISRYHFTDIKPASLFLSAGVTSSGFKLSLSGLKIDSTCVISRYFQWKLTDDELIAVLSHEQGHVHGKDIRNTYIIIGTDGWLRGIKFFSFFLIFAYFQELVNLIGIILTILIISILIFSLLFANSAMRALQQNRVFLMEIRSDEYGSNFVGNNKLADVLKKLPSVIPAPVDDNALGFLGFRVEILRDRGKELNEIREQDKTYTGPKIYKVS
ncbi:MAG: M48 family metalloprotease [Candidatus Hodarchaeales archaeon]